MLNRPERRAIQQTDHPEFTQPLTLQIPFCPAKFATETEPESEPISDAPEVKIRYFNLIQTKTTTSTIMTKPKPLESGNVTRRKKLPFNHKTGGDFRRTIAFAMLPPTLEATYGATPQHRERKCNFGHFFRQEIIDFFSFLYSFFLVPPCPIKVKGTESPHQPGLYSASVINISIQPS